MAIGRRSATMGVAETKGEAMNAACPFCASEHTGTIEIDTEGWAVECFECKSIGPTGKTRELAELLWDERILYSEMRKGG